MISLIRLSENTFIILFNQEITQQNFSQVKQLNHAVQQNLAQYIIDITPAYASIHITFNLLKISGQDLQDQLEKIIASHKNSSVTTSLGKVIEIPVYYGEEVALDLTWLAKEASLSPEEIIHLHSDKIYNVYAIGFTPGFAYLGNVDQRIAFPRKNTPRANIASGSVGIANEQTAVYPTESPGGWQIIGRTPISLIDYNSQHLTPFTIGDQVRFIPISKTSYIAMGGILSCL